MTSSSEQTTALIAQAREALANVGEGDWYALDSITAALADALEAERQNIQSLAKWVGVDEATDSLGIACEVSSVLEDARPRVVTSVAELDALPDDTIIRSQSGSAWRKDPRAPLGEWTQTRVMGSHAAKRVGLPATVLWVGGTE